MTIEITNSAALADLAAALSADLGAAMGAGWSATRYMGGGWVSLRRSDGMEIGIRGAGDRLRVAAVLPDGFRLADKTEITIAATASAARVAAEIRRRLLPRAEAALAGIHQYQRDAAEASCVRPEAIRALWTARVTLADPGI